MDGSEVKVREGATGDSDGLSIAPLAGVSQHRRRPRDTAKSGGTKHRLGAQEGQKILAKSLEVSGRKRSEFASDCQAEAAMMLHSREQMA